MGLLCRHTRSPVFHSGLFSFSGALPDLSCKFAKWPFCIFYASPPFLSPGCLECHKRGVILIVAVAVAVLIQPRMPVNAHSLSSAISLLVNNFLKRKFRNVGQLLCAQFVRRRLTAEVFLSMCQ